MNIGLSQEQIAMIVDVLRETGALKAVVYGSRAKGNWRDNSDVDIAVFGTDVNIGSLNLRLDELPMPYKFDVTGYESITHAPLREHIGRVGVEIYARKSSTDATVINC
jgi:predicted nucleotidyltransferase